MLVRELGTLPSWEGLSFCVSTLSEFVRAAEAMSTREQKVGDVEKESLYGYVFGVSGPGKIC